MEIIISIIALVLVVGLVLLFSRSQGTELVVVGRYEDDRTAHVMEEELRAQGIEVLFTANTTPIGSRVGPSLLKVRADQADAARKILSSADPKKSAGDS